MLSAGAAGTAQQLRWRLPPQVLVVSPSSELIQVKQALEFVIAYYFIYYTLFVKVFLEWQVSEMMFVLVFNEVFCLFHMGYNHFMMKIYILLSVK